MSDKDFTSLWKSRQGSGKKPHSSIIGGLQKLLEEKDETIEQKNAEIIDLKNKLNEDLKILTESQEKISQQQKIIEQLESQPENGDTNQTKVGPIEIDTLSGSPEEQIKSLKKKVISLEDKLYVFASLPDRIASLEEQRAKNLDLIESLEAHERKLRQKLRNLSIDNDAFKQLDKMESEILQLTKENERLKNQINALENDNIAPISVKTDRDDEIIQKNEVNQSEIISKLEEKYNKAIADYKELIAIHKLANMELEKAKNDIKNLSSLKSDKPSIPDNYFTTLEYEISVLKENLSKSNARNEDLEKEIEELNKNKITEINSSEVSKAENHDIDNLTDDLKKRIDKQKQIVSKLEIKNAELTKQLEDALKDTNSSERENTSADEILDLKEGITRLKEENRTLMDNLRSSSTPGQSNLLALIEDLQNKVNKLKKENSKLQKSLS